MRLSQRYGPERLEAASTRALRLRSYSYRTVKNILSAKQDRLPLEEETPSIPSTPLHDNIRGAGYYTAQEDTEC